MDERQNTLSESTEQPFSASCASCAEYLAGWKRAQADYQNAKKDAERDRVEFVKFANEQFVREFLPVIDQFALALSFVPDTSVLPEAQRQIWENWLKGVRAVQAQWDQLAASIGLERVSLDGAFDPLIHEAVAEEETEGLASNAIVRAVQDGWKLNGKILRPAKVVMSK